MGQSKRDSGYGMSALERAFLRDSRALGLREEPPGRSFRGWTETWAASGAVLPIPASCDRLLESDSYFAVLARRRSERSFGPLHARDVMKLLRQTCRITANLPKSRTLRPTPSAAGIFPLEVLLLANEVNGLRRGLWLHAAADRALRSLRVSRRDFARLMTRIHGGIGGEGPTPPAALLFVCDPRVTLVSYRSGLSLILRDAGALMATVGLTAAALGLSGCPAGLMQPLGAHLAEAPDDVWIFGGFALGGVARRPRAKVQRARPPSHR